MVSLAGTCSVLQWASKQQIAFTQQYTCAGSEFELPDKLQRYFHTFQNMSSCNKVIQSWVHRLDHTTASYSRSISTYSIWFCFIKQKLKVSLWLVQSEGKHWQSTGTNHLATTQVTLPDYIQITTKTFTLLCSSSIQHWATAYLSEVASCLAYSR